MRYQPPIDAARAQIVALRGQVDVIVALTHLPLEEDQAVLEAVPEIDLVLGGHEHENWYLRRGPSFAPIVKADANARSVAVVTMRIGATGTRPEVSVRFESLDARIPMQPTTQAVVRRWMDTGLEAFKREGLVPDARRGRDAGAARRPRNHGQAAERGVDDAHCRSAAPRDARGHRPAQRRHRSASTTCCGPARSGSTTSFASCRSAARW